MTQNYSHFIFSLTLFFLMACESIDSPVNSQVQPDSLLPTGIWQVDYSENSRLFGETQDLRYIVFDKDKHFYFLYSDSVNLRKQWTGVYAKPEDMNQLVFSTDEILNYSLSENLDKITLYGNVRTQNQFYFRGYRLNNLFDYKKFIKNIDTKDQIFLNIDSDVFRYNSITGNDDYFWLYNHISTIFKIDKTGSILDTLNHLLVPRTVYGIAYEEDKLWIKSEYNFIYEYLLPGPELVRRYLSRSYHSDYNGTDISVSDSHIWILSKMDQQVFKIDKSNLSVERTLSFTEKFDGISYSENSLYLNTKDEVHEFSLKSGGFKNSYKITDFSFGFSSTFVGSKLWIVHSREKRKYSISSIKFN